MKIEQIDNFLPYFPRKGYERFIKKQTHKLRRRQVKQWLNGNLKHRPNDKQYCGWTT